MAVVAGLFDSEVDATKAMDRLLRENLDGLDTRIIDGGSRMNTDPQPGPVVPIIPNTSGGPNSNTMGTAVAGSANMGEWMHDMDQVERNFYNDAMREGSTLAMAKVDDKDADKVRLIFQTFGGRTYMKDK